MVWLCFPGMTSSLANHRSTLSDVFSTIFLFLTFLNIHIYFIVLKTYDQQFTLTTKKSLHIIFKCCLTSPIILFPRNFCKNLDQIFHWFRQQQKPLLTIKHYYDNKDDDNDINHDKPGHADVSIGSD